VFVACDQAGLQDRGFAHYLHAFDDGDYAKAFLAGEDTHWKSAVVLRLIPLGTPRDKESKAHTAIREGAKRFRYAFLYGCGAEKAGQIIHHTVRAVRQIDNSFFSAQPVQLKQAGRLALESFEAGTPGLYALRKNLVTHARQHGWLPGLDDRHVPIRALHSALNFIVTSSEAIICKRWLVRVYDELHSRFCYGWDGDVVIVLWIHDELVCCCRPEIAEQVGEIMVRHAKEPAEFYGFKVPLDADFKIGKSWAGDDRPVEEGAVLKASPESKPTQPTPDLAVSDGEASFLLRNYAHSRRLLEKMGNVTIRTGDEPPPVYSLPAGLGAAYCKVWPQISPDDQNTIMASDLGRDIWEESTLSPAPEPAAPQVNGFLHFDSDIPPPSLAHLVGSKINCPFHDDGTPSLQVYGDHYHCFGCSAHGELSELLVKLNNAGIDAGKIITTGTSGNDDQDYRPLALRLWDEARPISGTLAEAYLTDVRRIDVSMLPPDIDLRFHPRCCFANGKPPCMLALLRDALTGEPTGVHRVRLSPDVFIANGKVQRQLLGRQGRSVVKLWPAGSELVIGEGIETVLAAATKLSQRPAWAAISAPALAKFPVLPGVERLVILVDHDDPGKNAAAKCIERWRCAGRHVRRLMPRTPGTDFNDVIKGTVP
jgi:hypothetical protein